MSHSLRAFAFITRPGIVLRVTTLRHSCLPFRFPVPTLLIRDYDQGLSAVRDAIYDSLEKTRNCPFREKKNGRPFYFFSRFRIRFCVNGDRELLGYWMNAGWSEHFIQPIYVQSIAKVSVHYIISVSYKEIRSIWKIFNKNLRKIYVTRIFVQVEILFTLDDKFFEPNKIYLRIFIPSNFYLFYTKFYNQNDANNDTIMPSKITQSNSLHANNFYN